MDIQNKNKDLTKIFDDRWNANHNYDAVKKMKEHDRNFVDKMFNTNSTTVNKPQVNYMEEGLKRLQGNMEAVKNNNRFKGN